MPPEFLKPYMRYKKPAKSLASEFKRDDTSAEMSSSISDNRQQLSAVNQFQRRQVETVNAGTDVLQKHTTEPLIQRKIGDAENINFGLDGKNKKSIEDAVDAGYSVFDGADTYGNTIDILAEVLKEKNKPRSSYQIIYKVSATKPYVLESHLRKLAAKFGGFLDHVLIHKAPDQYASQHWAVLNQLKNRDVIRFIGMGDARVDQPGDFDGKDSFEIDANALFLSPDADELVEKLNQSEKPVFVYNILSTLTNVLAIEARDVTSTKLAAFLSMLKGKVSKAEPILSSSDTGRIASNKAAYEYNESEETTVWQDRLDITHAIAGRTAGIPVNTMPGAVKEKMTLIYFSYQWDKSGLWESQEACNRERDQKLALFSNDALAVKYDGLGESDGKSFTLKRLIKMLYHFPTNCKRVEASNFLSEMFVE